MWGGVRGSTGVRLRRCERWIYLAQVTMAAEDVPRECHGRVLEGRRGGGRWGLMRVERWCVKGRR
jgi:hypothetical protein